MFHITMTCEDHPHLRWSTKSIAVTNDGRYNGQRNIFYHGAFNPDTNRESVIDDNGDYIPECKCSSSKLIAVNMDDVAAARAEGN